MAPYSTWEYITINQAALIYNVSTDRLCRWLNKECVPLVEINKKKMIRSYDLIQHLVEYNIPIPGTFLKGKIKKLLFIFDHKLNIQKCSSKIIEIIYLIKLNTNYIFDFSLFGENTHLKIMQLRPDIIILLSSNYNDKKIIKKIDKNYYFKPKLYTIYLL